MKYLLILLIALLFSTQGFSTDYYVDQNHNNAADTGNAGSETSPWLTIQYGVNQLTPGDILYIKAGTYYEKIDVDVSGTATHIITIRNFANDAVIISGEQSTNNLSLLWTDNAYLRIEGLHFTKNEKNYAQGLTLQGTAHHIEIVNNKVSEINFSTDPNASVSNNTNAVPMSALGDAASVGGADPDSVHHISFIGNEIFNNRTGYSENLTIGGNVSYFLMEYNHVHDNKNIGIDATGNYGESPVPAFDHARNGVIRKNHLHHNHADYSPGAGIYIDGGRDIIVENNLSHHNGYGGEIGCEESGATTNVIFRNNIFHHNRSTGMHFGAYDDGTQGTVVNCQVYNNTFYRNDTDDNYHGELILTQSQNGKIFNNIFFINSQNVFLYAYRTQTNLVFNYNLIYSTQGDITSIETTTDGENNGGNAYEGLADFYAATGYGANSLFGNPLFLDANNADFHVATNAPGINTGDPNHVSAVEEVDLDDAARAVDITDIGVDEQAAPLPVEYLTPFQAYAQVESILLTWTVSTEINADKYFIQRLLPNNQWTNIQTINVGQKTYKVLDPNPVKGINVYRLKQVDLDGHFSLSNMVSVVWESRPKTILYPNPTSGTVNFSNNQFFKISVSNALGKIVFLSEKTNQIPTLPSGLYFVHATTIDGAKTSVIQLIVE